MKCPACDRVLSRVTVGSLEVDVCRGGCGGIWFDGYELQQVDDADETAGETLLQIPRDPNLHVDASRKRECPQCQQVKLKRHLFSPAIKVEVDECPGCGGFWLDAGELQQIRLEKGRLEKTARPTSGLSAAAIRTLYQMKTAQRSDANL